jgi:hypothetical protein
MVLPQASSSRDGGAAASFILEHGGVAILGAVVV